MKEQTLPPVVMHIGSRRPVNTLEAKETQYFSQTLWASDLGHEDIAIVGEKVYARGPGQDEPYDVAWFIDPVGERYSTLRYTMANWYLDYCKWRAGLGLWPEPLEEALARTCESKCWYCGQVFMAEVGSSLMVGCDQALPVRYCIEHLACYQTGRPNLADLATKQAEVYGPDLPFWMQLGRTYEKRDGNAGLVVYQYNDSHPLTDNTSLGYAQVEMVRMSHNVCFDDLIEVPMTAWGDYLGDDVTRHNYKTWASEYKESEGVLWWSLERSYDTKSIVVLAYAITPEMFKDIEGLDNYGSLDDDGLYETQQEMQEEALMSWGKYDIPPVLTPYFEKALEFVADADAQARYRERFAEICDDAEEMKQLVWTLESAASQAGDYVEWLYETGTSAVLTGDDMEKLGQALRLSHIIPPPENQLALIPESEATDEEE